ncbi:uncharacterized protein MELLADRAFT_84159 [Melampsora larici-populina 98AG31]|uniref:NAD-dependent epimerase/dehydratase domain-containing protein n=1 Tax=Melampsora larici-populina (strain 98AG31 / pathotype 3-4-7) TaxID=747676 RepID=F4SBQ6_MELLP|nr:uncharacterized protein MELLADRAFT_84159 [Melampsora larici-populina 98AG31]EGF97907.1 hypothetical protein MELLADRAFT_84159 [Melampsora larici-populina 98AG31]
MPAITPAHTLPSIKLGSHILVTGASGFIAAWTCRLLLEQDFKVRGTVRSAEKGDYLTNLFKEFGDKWSYVIVISDSAVRLTAPLFFAMKQPNGFDEAVKDMDGILHLASPFSTHTSDDPYKTYVSPAVDGTLSVLKSAHGPNGATVKRIVVTSSIGAVTSFNAPAIEGKVFTEKDFNEVDPQILAEKGKDSPPWTAYFASKVLAEKAAWEYVKTNETKYDLVTICPPFVLGPIIHQVKNEAALNTSVNAFYEYLVGKGDSEAAKRPAGIAVDVRDVAAAHIQSLIVEKAGGNRYLVSKPDSKLLPEPLIWQDALDIVYASSDAAHWPQAPKRNPGEEKIVVPNPVDTSKSISDLGLKYHSFETTILDMCTSFKTLFKK